MRLQIKEQSMLPGAPAPLTSQGNFQRRPGNCKCECVCVCACYATAVKDTANSSLMKHFDFLHKKNHAPMIKYWRTAYLLCTNKSSSGACLRQDNNQLNPLPVGSYCSYSKDIRLNLLLVTRVPTANSVHRWHLG